MNFIIPKIKDNSHNSHNISITDRTIPLLPSLIHYIPSKVNMFPKFLQIKQNEVNFHDIKHPTRHSTIQPEKIPFISHDIIKTHNQINKQFTIDLKQKIQKRKTNTKKCSYVLCSNAVVSNGRCRTHGGGRRCKVNDCTKAAQSNSFFCWTHGGGKRCDVIGCYKSVRDNGFCTNHYKYFDDNQLFNEKQISFDDQLNDLNENGQMKDISTMDNTIIKRRKTILSISFLLNE